MDRRSLLKMTGTMGIGATFIDPETLFAKEQCEFIITDNGEIEAQQSGQTLQFWIDGMHLVGEDENKKVTSFSTLPSRCNITLFIDQQQSPLSYVESVVLMDENNQTLGAKYFDVSMKMHSGHAPYATFEGIALDYTKTYKIVYMLREGNRVSLKTATISNPQLSRFNTTWLPEEMKNDFKQFLAGGNNITPGLISTPFQYYTGNGIDLHCAKGRFTDIGSDGEFSCDIDHMHPDDDDGKHYMRYFIVMDPVGRLLGFHRRDHNPANKSQSYTTVTKKDSPWNAPFNVAKLQIADIRDCPWVQIYTEDVFDAISRSIIRLR